MEEIINEGIIKDSIDSLTIKQTEEILNQMKKSICKISGEKTGTGFFCDINHENKDIPCLMTNYHVLDVEYIKRNKKVQISMNDNDIIEEISIKEEDIIYLSKNDKYDLIIIKLNKKLNQKLNENINYLKLDEKLFNNNSELGYESIYILHYPNGKNASVSYGKGIKCNNDNYDLEHKCNTLFGSSGGPILNLCSNEVIGIHKGCLATKGEIQFNLGTFLKFPLNELKNQKQNVEKDKIIKKVEIKEEIKNPQKNKKNGNLKKKSPEKKKKKKNSRSKSKKKLNVKNKDKESSFEEKNKIIIKEQQIPQMQINPMVYSSQSTLARLRQEYELCRNDNDLMNIGCSFGLECDNIFKWRITMVGPSNTPYERGLFSISCTFPEDYPTHGPEFRFLNRIYHPNVDFKNENNLGHICIGSLDEWRIKGQVKDFPFYTVKQALFDIFCLFYVCQSEQNTDSEIEVARMIIPREQYNANAKRWTELFAKMD